MSYPVEVSLKTGLFKIKLTPPVPTASPCRIRHQSGNKDPSLTLPPAAYKVAIECLRALRFHARKAAHEQQSNVLSEDPDFQSILKKWDRLPSVHQSLFQKIDHPDYQIPVTAQGVQAIRELVRALQRDFEST